MTGAEVILIGAALAGTAVTVAAAKSQADAAIDQANFQAEVARQNREFGEKVGERNAQAAIEQAAAEETRLRRDQKRRLAQARAGFGAAGVQIEGSPLEVLADQVMEAEEDALLIRHGGIVAAQQARFAARVAGRNQRLIGIGARTAGEARAAAFRAEGTSSLIEGGGTAGQSLLVAT